MQPHDTTNDIPYGYCECGCGQKTTISPRTNTIHGYIKGQPRRFIKGHSNYVRPLFDPGQRFWEHVDPGAPDTCWEWQGYISTTGYGRLRLNGRFTLAHRLSYELHNGPILNNLWVLHKCDNPKCVNPAHLFIGTPADNTHDMLSKKRWQPPRTRGESIGTSKITAEQVIDIRNLWAQGVSQSEIGRRFGISSHQAHMIVRRKSWRHVP